MTRKIRNFFDLKFPKFIPPVYQILPPPPTPPRRVDLKCFFFAIIIAFYEWIISYNKRRQKNASVYNKKQKNEVEKVHKKFFFKNLLDVHFANMKWMKKKRGILNEFKKEYCKIYPWFFFMNLLSVHFANMKWIKKEKNIIWIKKGVFLNFFLVHVH